MEFRTLTKRIAQKFDVEIPTSDTLDPNKNIIHSEKIMIDLYVIKFMSCVSEPVSHFGRDVTLRNSFDQK